MKEEERERREEGKGEEKGERVPLEIGPPGPLL